MEKVLKLIGFDENELKMYKNEISVFKKVLNLNKKDIERAAKDLIVNFDLSFISIQDLFKELFLSVFLDFKELIEKKNKIVQMAVPMPNAVAGVINELSLELKISSSEYILIYLAGIVFDVYHELGGQGPNLCKRCGLNLSRETLYRNPMYPKPHGVITCFGYCDEIHKIGEIMEMEHGLVHYNLSQMQGIGYEEQKEYLSEAVLEFIEDLTLVSKDLVKENLENINTQNLVVNLLLNKIQGLTGKSKDVYITFNELSLLHIFNLIYLHDHHTKAKRVLQLFIRELKQRMKNGEVIMERPLRIGCMHLPFTNASMDRTFREHGAAVIVSSMYAMETDSGVYENESDRFLRSFFKNKMLTDIEDKTKYYDSIIEEYELDGFLFGQFENDRALGGNQTLVMSSLDNKEKAYYLSVYNWQKMGANDPIKLESLIEVIRERTKYKCEF